MPGMGETTARYFRDKLAMRVEGAQPGHARPRVRAHAQRRRSSAVRRGGAAAVGAQAALGGRGHRHHTGSSAPTSCGRRSTRWATGSRSTCSSSSSPATSSTSTRWSGSARSIFTRRTSTARRRSASRTRAASSSRAPCPRPTSAWKPLIGDQPRGAATLGLRARRHAHRVHPQRGRRPLLLSRDGGARRRRLHRRRRRGGHRHQPVARVGEDRDRRRGPTLSLAERRATVRRPGADASRARSSPTRRPTTIPRSSAA